MTDSSESRGRDIRINGTQQKCNNSVVRLTTADLAKSEISPTSIQITFPAIDRDVHVKVYNDGDAALPLEKFQYVVTSAVTILL